MKIDKLAYLLILFFSLLALMPLFQPGFMGYDFIYQGARLAAFYQNLKEGVILPRWAGGPMNAGYGHPVLIFLYPFVFYLASFWHFLGFSLVASLKIILALAYFFSGIFAYLFFKNLSDKKTALALSLFYLFIPYRFLNLYGRAALGEHLATTFLPLIFLAIWKNFQAPKTKNILFLALATALTILSHNLIFLLASPLIFIFIIYLYLQTKNKARLIFHLLPGFLLGFSLSAFFWFPLVFERKYLRYDEIANPDYFWHNGILPFHQIFFPPEYQLFHFSEKPFGALIYPTLAPTQWFLFLLIPFLIYKFYKNRLFVVFLLALFFYFLTGAFLATKLMFWLILTLPALALVQQACRFLNLPLFASPFLLWLTTKAIKPSRRYLFLSLFTLFNFLLNLPYFWNLKIPRQFKDDHYFFNEYSLTADTGQITPRWGLINYFVPAPQKVQLVAGGIDKIEIEKWHSQEHVYKLVLREPSQIADNTLYFPGWTVYVDGKKAPLNFQDMNWRGIITYPVPAGTHQIKVKFEETRLRLIGDCLSLSSLLLIILITTYKTYKKLIK